MTTTPRIPAVAAIAVATIALAACTAAPAEPETIDKPAPAQATLDADISRKVLALPTAQPTPDPTETPAGDFVVVFDDLGVLSMAVPADWSDVDGAPYTTEDGREWVSVLASPDIASFYSSWDTAGIEFGGTLVDGPLDDEVLLSFLGNMVDNLSGACQPGAVEEAYDDGLYAGYYSTLLACGETDAAQFLLTAQDAEGTHFVYLSGQFISEEDKTTTLDAILSSFLMTVEADRSAPADRTAPSVF